MQCPTESLPALRGDKYPCSSSIAAQLHVASIWVVGTLSSVVCYRVRPRFSKAPGGDSGLGTLEASRTPAAEPVGEQDF